jgi:Beta propeller domain
VIISFDDHPTTPTVLGDIEIGGFTVDIMSINHNNTLILALGTDEDDDATPLGLQISLFNTTNQTNPELVHRFVIRTNTSESRYGSTALFDVQSCRYLQIDEGGRGRIIIPVSYSEFNGTSFDGYSVFSLSPDGIAPLFDVSHYTQGPPYEDDAIVDHAEQEEVCSGCGYLQDRIFAIDGKVITLKGQSVRSHNLTSGAFLWGLNFTGADFCYGISA